MHRKKENDFYFYFFFFLCTRPFIAETATGCVLIAEGGMSTNNMQMAVDDMNRGTIGVCRSMVLLLF